MRRMIRGSLGRLIGGARGALLVFGLSWAMAGTGLANIEPEASRTYYEAAVKEVEEGDLRAAVVQLKNALQRDPTNPDARLLLGEVYLDLGDGAAAEKELRAAGRYGTAPERTLAPLGRALLLQGRFEETMSHLAEAADEGDVLLLRADAQAGLRQLEEARALYEGAAKNDPQEARAYLGLAHIAFATGDFAEAEAQIATALAHRPDFADALLLQGETRRLAGLPEAALAPFRQVLAAPAPPAGTAVRARLGLAAALVALERDAEAESELAEVRKLVPDVPLAAYLQALIKVRQRDLPAARTALLTAGAALQDFAPAQFLFGIVYYAGGELETARVWLSRYLASRPGNPQARKLLAATLLRLNATDEALRVIEPAKAAAGDDPQVLLLVGNAYLRKGRAAEASELLQRAAELAPQDPRVLSQLAISHLATGQRDEALAALTATLDLGADASAIGYALAFAHLRTGAFADALKVAQNLRRRFPQSAVAANLEGGAYAALGQREQAHASFEAVLALEPAFHEARANLAALKAQTGDFAGAEAEYQAILERDKSYVTALMGMAALADRRGERADTRRWLEQAAAADPAGVKPSLVLAEHHIAAGDAAAATAVMEGLARHHPKDPQVLLALGRLQSGMGRPAAAAASYQRLVEATGGSVAARLLLAEAQLAAGDLAAARGSYEALTEAEADNAVVWNNLAWLYQQEGDPRAVAHGERALQLAPGQPAVMDTLGWILLEARETARAEELLQQAHEAAPGSAEITYHYAAALHRNGKDAAARELLQSVLQGGQPFPAQAEAAALLDSLNR